MPTDNGALEVVWTLSCHRPKRQNPAKRSHRLRSNYDVMQFLELVAASKLTRCAGPATSAPDTP